MLDHLSHGRLELGVGRGIVPYEVARFGVDPEEGPDPVWRLVGYAHEGAPEDIPVETNRSVEIGHGQTDMAERSYAHGGFSSVGLRER